MQAQIKSYYPENHQFNQLMVPSTAEELDYLNEEKECYEKIYHVKFIDLGEFVSHIVAEQMRESVD